MAEFAVKVDNLVKRYPNTVAVDGISFSIARGITAALLGGNGAGKTTTLSILLGLLLPTSGSVQVLGEDMLRHRYRVLPRMNFSSPFVDLPHRLTVRQNLLIYARLMGCPIAGNGSRASPAICKFWRSSSGLRASSRQARRLALPWPKHC
jgi:ABC-2 type transport system ATP-binding protein